MRINVADIFGIFFALNFSGSLAKTQRKGITSLVKKLSKWFRYLYLD